MGSRSIKVTQMAIAESINNTVYDNGVYASRGSNPRPISPTADSQTASARSS